MAQVRRRKTVFGVSGCLLADIGEYLDFLISVLSDLASALVSGRHIDQYSDQKLQECEDDDDDFADLTPAYELSDKVSTLQ